MEGGYIGCVLKSFFSLIERNGRASVLSVSNLARTEFRFLLVPPVDPTFGSRRTFWPFPTTGPAEYGADTMLGARALKTTSHTSYVVYDIITSSGLPQTTWNGPWASRVAFCAVNVAEGVFRFTRIQQYS